MRTCSICNKTLQDEDSRLCYRCEQGWDSWGVDDDKPDEPETVPNQDHASCHICVDCGQETHGGLYCSGCVQARKDNR